MQRNGVIAPLIPSLRRSYIIAAYKSDDIATYDFGVLLCQCRTVSILYNNIYTSGIKRFFIFFLRHIPKLL